MGERLAAGEILTGNGCVEIFLAFVVTEDRRRVLVIHTGNRFVLVERFYVT